MKKKKHIGKLVSVKFSDRKEPIYGFIINYNDDWTLMKYNPVDYVIDGYIIFKNKNIEGFHRSDAEKFKEKVIRLKGLESSENDLVPITDITVILKYLTAKFGVFQFQTKSETICYLGKVKSLDSKQLIIDYLNTKGQWDKQMTFRLGDIRVIEFETDYIKSLQLVCQAKK